MYDIDRDSLVPVHEQIAGQIAGHIATGALQAGAKLAEYRTFAQELLTNPQAVLRAYADLESEEVLAKSQDGGMVVTHGAAAICRARLREAVYARMRDVVAFALGSGMGEAEIIAVVERAMGACKVVPLTPYEVLQAIRKPTYDSSAGHRASEGIQDLSRKSRPGPT